MGNTKAKPGIFIQMNKPFYLPGEVVDGCVYIHAPKPYPAQRIILTVNGYEKSWWRPRASPNQNKSNIPAFKGDKFGECKIVQASFCLRDFGGQQNFQGQYAFPFEFQLPNFIPGSYRDETDDYKALVVYEISCSLISANKKNDQVSVTNELIIREPQKSQQQYLYGETYIYPQSCFCFKAGVAKICCFFEKNQYCPGDQCIAICQVDNVKSKLSIKQIEIRFKKILTLTSGFGETTVYQKLINTSSFPGVGAHSQYVGQKAQRKAIKLQYKDSKMSIHPSSNGRLVKCHYILEVIPKLSGLCTKGSHSFEVGVNIIQQPLYVPQIQQPEGWSPEVYSRSSIYLNQNRSNNSNDNLQQMANYGEYGYL